MERDYYQILEVPRDASEKDIKRAYHRLARERHPDKGTTPDQIQQLQEEFSLISTAYNTLKDREKRAEYDARLKKGTDRWVKASEEPAGGGGKAAAGGAGAGATTPAATAASRSLGPRERTAIAQRAYAKGMQLFNVGDFLRASEFIEAAIKNDDSQALYHAKLAVALMRAHKGFNRAVLAVQRAIELDPYNIDHRLVMGEIYETVGSKSKAITTYREILKWDASNAQAIERLSALGAGAGKSLLNQIRHYFKRR